MTNLKLGLIGDNIAHSSAPLLHITAGALCGQTVSYDRLVPRALGMAFDAVFDMAQENGYRGLNITYPYKEIATRRVKIPDPLVRVIGAVNTVVFTAGETLGYNTDYTGFVAAYHAEFGHQAPEITCVIGTGGVGKAVAFGLLALDARVIRCVDLDIAKAEALAVALRAAGTATRIETYADIATAARGASGLVNCTPVGMVGYDGTPLPPALMQGAVWAFDAVYTPVETQFLTDAAAAGLATLSGYELFFEQGVAAWHIFTDLPLERAALRRAIAPAPPDTPV
jgi:shikimate dehydrogenase